MNTAKGEYEKAKSGTAAAKTAYDAAEAKLKGIDVKTPKTKLDAAKGEAATAQAALDKANATLADSKTKAAEAAAHKAKARSARDAAKVKSDQPTRRMTTLLLRSRTLPPSAMPPRRILRTSRARLTMPRRPTTLPGWR